mmetsp:Transcript_74984/g.199987  ORF Transcript_74984/g.199987 Transcript_74984/m.199987 type:complete len:254 (-) Transcript_74984:393-1154(-)
MLVLRHPESSGDIGQVSMPELGDAARASFGNALQELRITHAKFDEANRNVGQICRTTSAQGLQAPVAKQLHGSSLHIHGGHGVHNARQCVRGAVVRLGLHPCHQRGHQALAVGTGHLQGCQGRNNIGKSLRSEAIRLGLGLDQREKLAEGHITAWGRGVDVGAGPTIQTSQTVDRGGEVGISHVLTIGEHQAQDAIHGVSLNQQVGKTAANIPDRRLGVQSFPATRVASLPRSKGSSCSISTCGPGCRCRRRP